MQEIFLCSICNVSSGSCAEDCAYCTQSAKYNAEIDKYKYKPIPQILEEAKRASKNGALGFCLVTSGRTLDSKRTEYIAEAARAIVKEGLHLHLIGCNGIADVESLVELKNAGIASYNHNLETSQNFFSNICTTHSVEERFQTQLTGYERARETTRGLRSVRSWERKGGGRVGRIEWTFSMLCKR